MYLGRGRQLCTDPAQPELEERREDRTVPLRPSQQLEEPRPWLLCSQPRLPPLECFAQHAGRLPPLIYTRSTREAARPSLRLAGLERIQECRKDREESRATFRRGSTRRDRHIGTPLFGPADLPSQGSPRSLPPCPPADGCCLTHKAYVQKSDSEFW